MGSINLFWGKFTFSNLLLLFLIFAASDSKFSLGCNLLLCGIVCSTLACISQGLRSCNVVLFGTLWIDGGEAYVCVIGIGAYEITTGFEVGWVLMVFTKLVLVS